MTEQQSAPQPGQVDQRLAGISHHFLSEDPVQPRPTESRLPVIITIAGTRDHPFPALPLAAIMARGGIACDIHGPGQPAILLRPEDTGDTGPAHGRLQQTLRFVISDAPDGGSTEIPAILLLAVPASARGLREGFVRLKRYLGLQHPARVGVTLLDCADPERARRYFGQLRQAGRRFLATELSSYGAIAGGLDLGGHSPELSGIARLLTDDLGLDLTATAGAAAHAIGEGMR